jgi:DNA (cytosine-5)-methyltransferase 1
MKQLLLDVHPELIVDLFAGGGGMSTAFEMALGRSPDIAINHNEEALSMHRANHPQTRHFIADVYEVCPKGATQGRPVGWLHLSPDCTHHSQAAGGQPRSKKIRGLSWVGYRWAGQVAPRVISLENVVQILKWGPLIAKRDKGTGRVITLDMVQCPKTGKMVNRIAEPGERVPVQRQFLVPDPKRAGQTWKKFVAALHALGYHVEYATLNAADFGGHTTRERLFMIARRSEDGEPIQWPEPTHFKNPGKGQQKWRAAAECIDWSIPCPSIFGRKKPLAEATLRRIAKGIQKYVLNNADPFIVPIAHYTGSQQQIVMAHLAHLHGNCDARDVAEPLRTVSAGGQHHAVVSAFLSRQFGNSIGQEPSEPMPTTTAGGGGKSALASAFLASYYTDDSNRCRDIRDPAATITTENRLGLVECTLSQEHEADALRVAAFLMRYYGEGGQWGNPGDPMSTITTKDRLALVTVQVQGVPHVIVDIGLRMLQPRELYRGQDFPETYIIEQGHDGREFSKSAQVRMCGNSVDPLPAAAFIEANARELSVRRKVA